MFAQLTALSYLTSYLDILSTHPYPSITMAVSSISKTALRRAMAGTTTFNGARTYASKVSPSPYHP
jgi:hypothetical protein